MENSLKEVWVLRIYSPARKDQPEGWRDVAAFTTPTGAQGALQKLHAVGRVVPDPKSINEDNPNGNSFELKRLDVKE
jgi:hypothetical protein